MTVVVEAILADLIGGLGKKMTGNLAKKLFGSFRNIPQNKQDLANYQTQMRGICYDALSATEKELGDAMAIAMRNNKLAIHDKIGRAREKVMINRKEIMNSISASGWQLKNLDELELLIKTAFTYYTTLLFHAYEAQTLSNIVTEALEEDEEVEEKVINNALKDLRQTLNAMEAIWTIRKSMDFEKSLAKEVHDSLSSINKDIVDIADHLEKASQTQLDRTLTDLTLRKPKLFGKDIYYQNLGKVMIATLNTLEYEKMLLTELHPRITSRYPTSSFTLDDMEKAAEILVKQELAHALVEEEGKKIFVVYPQTKVKCGKCDQSGGYLTTYYMCESTGEYVCSNCISWLGLCKLCNKTMKKYHPQMRIDKK